MSIFSLVIDRILPNGDGTGTYDPSLPVGSKQIWSNSKLCLNLINYSFFYHKHLLKGWSNSALFTENFSKLNEYFMIFIIIFLNSEPIEQNLNSIFANKNGKIYKILTEKLHEITNSFILVFHPFANICLDLVKYKTNRFISIQIWLVW